jgi:hypothetical protein
LGQTEYQCDRNEHPGDGAKDTIESLGKNESAFRLRYHKNGQKRPSGIVQASPECDVKCEQGRGKCLDRKSQTDNCLMIEPIRLFEEPTAQRHALENGFHQ